MLKISLLIATALLMSPYSHAASLGDATTTNTTITAGESVGSSGSIAGVADRYHPECNQKLIILGQKRDLQQWFGMEQIMALGNTRLNGPVSTP